MLLKRYQQPVSLHMSLVAGTFLVFVFLFTGNILFAQEGEVVQNETSDNAVLVESTISASSTPATTTADVLSPVSPYPTEALLGDKVYDDFVVGPGKVDLSIRPGETKVVEITVSNRTGVKRFFDINTEDMKGSNDPTVALVLLGEDRGPYSLKDYIRVEAPRFELEHNQRARIPVTVSIPPDAEPGGLYGSVLVSTVSQEARKGDGMGTAPQSAVVARIGSSFFITIPGAAERDGELTDFKTVPPKSVYQEGPIKLGLLFENRGSAHLAPYGEIRVRNMFNEEVGFMKLDPWFVLPQAVRLREVTWDRDILFGRYTATAYINPSYDNVVDEMSYTFWVLPWKPVTGIFAGIFIIVFLIRAFFTRFEFKKKT